MKKTIYCCICILMLSSCARSCQSWKYSTQSTTRNYHIECYSGGKLIKQYDFNGILNNQEHSDGFYWFKGDTLIEVSGDIVITSDH